MESNKEVVLRYVKAFNERDEAKLLELFTPDALVYGVLGAGGMDVVMPIWRELWSGLDLTLHVKSIIEEGDTVAVRYVDKGTSIGTFRGLAPTGKSFETAALEWFVMHDGRIHRRWGARDSLSQARQMGLPLG